MKGRDLKMLKRVVFCLVCFLVLFGGGVFAREEIKLVPNEGLDKTLNTVDEGGARTLL